jgi:LysM repeat protein
MRTLLLLVSFIGISWAQSQTPLNVIHVVKDGETLYKISRDYEMTVSELRELNPKVSVLQPGMKLNVRKKLGVESRKQPVLEHQVKPGETLYQISKQYKVKVSQIRELNEFTEDQISVGQMIKIPIELGVAMLEATPVIPATALPKNPVAVQTPVVVEAAKPPVVNSEIQGGIIEKRSSSTKTEFVSKTDTKKVTVLDSSMMNAGDWIKSYIWMQGVPSNQVIGLVNPETQQMVYALSQGKREKQSADSIMITPLLAEKLGIKRPFAELKIQYVVPKP